MLDSKHHLSLALTLLTLAPLPGWAGSQEATTDGEPETVLDEITVTARRREIDQQRAPVAVSALSGETFEQANLVKLDQLDAYLPSLMVTKNDGAGRVVSIRGVGWETAQNLSTQPSVLVYLDGVYVANPLAAGLTLGSIERIEVFRGPQGTEFGQGTTGGAINIVTRKADFASFAGQLELAVGTHDLRQLSAGFNRPLGEHLALRASALERQRDGFSEIEGGRLDGYDLDDADVLMGTLTLEWVPSARFSTRLSGFHHRSDQHGAAQKHIDDPNPDPRRLTQDYPSLFALDNDNLSLALEWSTPGGALLRSLTGYQKLAKRQAADGDRLTEDLVSVDLTGLGAANFDLLPFWNNDSEVFSQEIALLFKRPRLDGVVGLYHLRHVNDNFFLEAVGPAPVDQFAEQLADPSPETLPPFVPPLEFVEDRRVTRQDSAVFGRLSLRLAERWTLTLGGRVQRDEARDETTQFWSIDSEQRLRDQAFTWKIGSEVALSDDHLLYAQIATGWKNGGTNPGALTGGALDVPVVFAPERVTAFEIGSRNRLASGRARLSAHLFHYDYENYQFIQEDPVPFSAGTGNIPEVAIRGVETELSWRLADRLRLDGQATLLDGEIRSPLLTLDVADFLASGFGRFTATGIEDRASLRVDLKGKRPPKLADLSFRLGLSHTLAINEGSLLTSRLELLHRGEYSYRVFDNPVVDRVPSYETLGLFLGYEPSERPWTVELRASNLFDRAGVNSRFTNPIGLHTTSDELIPPRQLIAAFRYRF